MVATVTLIVAAVGILGPHISHLDVFVIQSPPDLAALFAVGILCAGIVSASQRRSSWPWAWLAFAAAAPVFATIWWQGSVWTLDRLFWVDLSLGPAVGCLLAGLAAGQPARLLRLLDARPIRNLGLSSYSLYLTHGPIVVFACERVVAGRVAQGFRPSSSRWPWWCRLRSCSRGSSRRSSSSRSSGTTAGSCDAPESRSRAVSLHYALSSRNRDERA